MANYGDYKYYIDEIRSRLNKGTITIKDDLSLSGKKITDVGSPENPDDVMSMKYADNNYINKNKESTVFGEKTFKDKTIFDGDVVFNGSVDIDGESDFVSLDGDDNINGVKTFNDKTIFKGKVETEEDVSFLSGDVKFNTKTKFNNKVQFNDDVSIATGDLFIKNNSTIDGNLTVNGDLIAEGLTGNYVGLSGNDNIYGTKVFNGETAFNDRVNINDGATIDDVYIGQGKADTMSITSLSAEAISSPSLSLINNNYSILNSSTSSLQQDYSILSSNFLQLQNINLALGVALAEHIGSGIATEEGQHGIRDWEGNLQIKIKNIWVDF